MKTRGKEYFKASVLFICGIASLVAFVFLLALPFVLWILEPYHQLDIWIIDKTVPYTDFREHAGLFWLLNNNKIAKPGSKVLYDVRTDYYGFYPISKDEWRTVNMPADAKRPDIIYITDTYGVYRDDYLQKKLPQARSTLLYGGLNNNDYKTLQSALGGGNTLIAEFNTAASPTNARDRDLFGRLIGLKWNGWIGNYYENLAREGGIPDWIISNWQEETGELWSFSGRGIVLLNEQGNVEIFTENEDLGPSGMKVVLDSPWDTTIGIKKQVSYRYWFEWVSADPLVEEIAHYKLDLKENGRKKLEKLGLPSEFPAIVRYKNEQFVSWYFAGDFADLQFSGTTYRMKGIQTIKRLLADDTVDNNSYFYWKVYAPLMDYILAENEVHRKEYLSASRSDETRVPVRAIKEGFQLKSNAGVWDSIFIRSVNLGPAEPGKYFTEFTHDTYTYLRWLETISGIGANTVRLYTLLPPEFYRAFEIYNLTHPESPVLLLQGLWPEEHPPGSDYLQRGYQEEFQKEINYVVDAVYGRANVPERKGRAWGVYVTDVSKWLLGWLVGRELESAEVIQTDANHKDAVYSGTYVSSGPHASATEVWLAESLDAVALAEAERYGALHPLGIVSWPTLDPIDHDTEWDVKTGKKNRANDRASIQIEHLEISDKMIAGIFGAYHIYPNYPDFIINEPMYDAYKDSVGTLRYGGYLQEFFATHVRYPAIVAEFGMANGAGVAHISSDGLNHGGIDEVTAGIDILRMYAAIKNTGYAGASIFEFMDEWAKKAWVTEPFVIPFDRRVLWHNAIDPEQNYGLMANESIPPAQVEKSIEGTGALAHLDVSHDSTYLYLTLVLSNSISLDNAKIMVGIDTFDRSLGQMAWPKGLGPTASGMEFLLDIQSPQAKLQVLPSYNIASGRYASLPMQHGIFEDINMLVNGKVITKNGTEIPEKRFNASIMRKGAFDESGNLWNVDENLVRVRIPWNRINITDPSSLKVLNDSRNIGDLTIDQLRTAITDGFVFDVRVLDITSGAVIGKLKPNATSPYIWDGWEEIQPYRERLKKSYYIVRDTWKKEAAVDMPVIADFIKAQLVK